MDSDHFWRLVWAGMQWLYILLYAASVAAFLLVLQLRSWRVPTCFSGLLFLALCPFFILFVAAVLRLSRVFYHIDRIANAQQMLIDGVQPFYLGAGTSLVLVFLYSGLYVWRRPLPVA